MKNENNTQESEQEKWERLQKEKEVQRQKAKDAKLSEALRANLHKRKSQKKQRDQEKV